MERFAFKIDNVLKANLYKICRLCGIDNPEKVSIFEENNEDVVDVDAEPELSQKIKDLIGFAIYKDDKMPQCVCTLCVDKINDFYEFREMCFSTDMQTRKLLGIKSLPKRDCVQHLEVKTEPTTFERGDKRGKKRKIYDFDGKEIKEEVDKSLINSWSLNKKIKGLIDDSMSKKKKLQTFEEFVQNSKKVKTEIKHEPITGVERSLKHLCDICDQRFATKVKLERHRRTSHRPNIAKFFCLTCNDEVAKANDIKSHQLWHKLSKTPYTCGLCGESLLTVNLFTRHLGSHTQILVTPISVYDRQCSLCHGTFLTNFLYNIHACALRAKKCGGCSRKVKTDTEYMMHAASCDKAYLVASKHIGDCNEAIIQIKNENDAEALMENFTPNANVPLTMVPIVALTRLPIEENQKTNAASTSAAAAATVAELPDVATKAQKKSGKKGMSKKDLKRVDDLLKFTMDTLVSIKHEPEINVDAEAHRHEQMTYAGNNAIAAHKDKDSTAAVINVDNSGCAGDGSGNGMYFGDDDFQNQSDDSDDSEIGDHTDVVKQEPQEYNAFKIKQEIPDNLNEMNTTETPATSEQLSKVPVLKLKIIKEHGTLNSSLVNENHEKGEKKKKKKKRKDAEKTVDDDQINNLEANEANTLTATSTTTSEAPITGHRENEQTIPLPEIVMNIKQERVDNEYIEGNLEKNHSVDHSKTTLPESATIMTSIPLMQLQIACVSSGVEFNKDTDRAEENVQETVPQDVKPNREELDRLLAAERQTLYPTEHNQVRKSVATKSTSQRNVNNNNNSYKTTTTNTANNATSSNEALPKIVAVSSVGSLSSARAKQNVAEEFMPAVRIKTEPRDDDDDNGYYNQQYENHNELDAAAFGLPNTNDEQAQLNSFDFSNVRIKQEKDIDISESQLTVQHCASILNSGEIEHFSTDAEVDKRNVEAKAAATEKGVDNENEDDNDDDDDDEDTEIPAEDEAREYREFEWPSLSEADIEKQPEEPSGTTMAVMPAPSLGLMIANVRSETNNHKNEHTTNEAKQPPQKVIDNAETNSVSNSKEFYMETAQKAEVNLLKALPVNTLSDIVSKNSTNEENGETDIDEDDENEDDSNAPNETVEEEQQNILNHEMFESNLSSNNTQTTTATVDDIVAAEEISTETTSTQKTTPMAKQKPVSYLEDISSSSCSNFSSIGNDNSAQLAPSQSLQQQPLKQKTLTTSKTSQANHEETENLHNENVDARRQHQRQQEHENCLINPTHSHMPSTTSRATTSSHVIASQQHHALLLDNSNINEIAENNNNANIERELLVDIINHQQQHQHRERNHAEENVNESLASSETLPSPEPTQPSQTTETITKNDTEHAGNSG